MRLSFFVMLKSVRPLVTLLDSGGVILFRILRPWAAFAHKRGHQRCGA